MTTYRFISRSTGSSNCDTCGRDLGAKYLLEHTATGIRTVMGRRCASKAMGWATTAVEMEAKRLKRMALVATRRAELVAEFPGLHPNWIASIPTHDYLWRNAEWRTLAQEVAA